VGPLTSDQLQAYHRDGYLLVPDLYSSEEMLEWKSHIKDLLLAEKFSAKHGVRVWMNEQLPDYFRPKMADPKVAAILEQIIGPFEGAQGRSAVDFLSVKTVFKNSATTFSSPWHQDRFYWGGIEKISIWIALDDATPENGCLKFIPGTHHKELPKKVVSVEEGFDNRIDDSVLEGLPVETIPVARGGAVFFSDLAVHSSHPNTAGTDRWSMISTYRSGTVKDDSAIWKTSMPVSGR
jgi:ectoine hydroxylase-related dioxygenase (phytanoyl-CoA dioxygenase family)